jgi:LmbE family N-acetylglucosaminyl deacetylase/glycosyltransferase involved in cell wall biosynthesis
MKISVVIPTYNGATYVEEAIQSVLAQTRPADEVIISDDNSKDETLAICNKYADKLKIFQNPNGPSGFVNGWNHAIAHATSEYITILHQDDLLDPTFLEEMEKAIKLHPNVKHFFAPCRYIDGEGNFKRNSEGNLSGGICRYTGQEYANAYERVKNHIHRCPGVVTHRDIFKVCQYRECAGHIADDDFFLRVGNYTDVVGVLKPLASYREHEGSETGHLPFLKINKRLLLNYHFQLEHTLDNPLLSLEIKETFERWVTEYIHRLFIFGVKSFSWDYVILAMKYWLIYTEQDGFRYMKYDIKSLFAYAKETVRSLHVKFLYYRANLLNDAAVKTFSSYGNVVIIAPHPDDEVIGCGGLIARLVAEGRPPHIIVMTGGEGSHAGCCPTDAQTIITARRGLTRKALAILGVPESHLHEMNFRDGGISDTYPEVEKLRRLLAQLHPDSVLVPHWGEGWPDHVRTAQIVKDLCDEKVHVWEYCVWMWYYNVWRNLDWKHAACLRMSATEHKKKLNAMEAYIKPLAPCGHPWSGVLPKLFVKANQGTKELYFRVK